MNSQVLRVFNRAIQDKEREETKGICKYAYIDLSTNMFTRSQKAKQIHIPDNDDPAGDPKTSRSPAHASSRRRHRFRRHRRNTNTQTDISPAQGGARRSGIPYETSDTRKRRERSTRGDGDASVKRERGTGARKGSASERGMG